MIKGKELKKEILAKLASGLELTEAIYQVAKSALNSLPLIECDWKTIKDVVQATQYYAHEVHPEYMSKWQTTESVTYKIWREFHPQKEYNR